MNQSLMSFRQVAVAAGLVVLSTSYAQAQATAEESPVKGVSAQVCVNTSEAEVHQLFTRWNNSLKTLDPNQVAANYAPDAVLLPTVSNKPRTTPTEIKDYFVEFLKKKPQGTIDKSYVKIGCNKAYDVGVYTFKLTDKQNKVHEVKARYSYVYQYVNGQWLIAHHHSSVMPE